MQRVIPVDWLKMYSEEELQKLLAGDDYGADYS